MTWTKKNKWKGMPEGRLNSPTFPLVQHYDHTDLYMTSKAQQSY